MGLIVRFPLNNVSTDINFALTSIFFFVNNYLFRDNPSFTVLTLFFFFRREKVLVEKKMPTLHCERHFFPPQFSHTPTNAYFIVLSILFAHFFFNPLFLDYSFYSFFF